MEGKILDRSKRFALPVAMDYGMVFVLALLILVMSVLTLKDQQPTGRDAGLSVADVLVSQFHDGSFLLKIFSIPISPSFAGIHRVIPVLHLFVM